MRLLASDLRHALTSLRRAPAFAAAVILTLALGIGANTAVFSVVNAVVLKPLAYPQADRLGYVGWDWSGSGGPSSLSRLKYAFVKENARSFEGVTTYRTTTALLGQGTGANDARGLRVDDAFFRVFGMSPALGRAFTPEEYVEEGASVVVLGHDLWHARYGGAPSVLGTTIQLEGQPYTVIGVMPKRFRFAEAPGWDEFLMPFHLSPDPEDRGHNHMAIGRLARGVSREAALQELRLLSVALRQAYPEGGDEVAGHFYLTNYASVYVGDLGRTLWILLGAVGFVLLITCANVANLLLARASDRRRELAVRAAIGAGRARILTLLMVEALLLAAIAGLAGVLAGVWTVEGLIALAPHLLLRGVTPGIDVRVLAFGLAVSTFTGIVFGLAAALPVVRSDLISLLREGDRAGSAARGARRLRAVLVISETAIACVLLAGAGLLIASFARLRSVDPGFQAHGVLTASFARVPRDFDAERLWRFQQDALSAVRALPSVLSAATTANLPLERGMNIPVTVGGNPDATEGDVEWRAVSAGYFEVLRIPLLAGRVFDEGDDAARMPVVIVNESFVRRYFSDTNPLGQQIQIGAYQGRIIPSFDEPPRTIVGVVPDVKEIRLDAPPRRTVFVPQPQVSWIATGPPRFLIRSDRLDLAVPQVRGVLTRAALDMPPPSFNTMRDVVGASIAAERFNALLMTLFAGLAILLTAVGLYGVLAYTVRQRRREIGIRMALGAHQRDVLAIVMRQGLTLAFTGLLIGLAAALALTRVLQRLLFEVEATDPTVYAIVAVFLLTIAAAASYLPARRAMSVPPLTVLRDP